MRPTNNMEVRFTFLIVILQSYWHEHASQIYRILEETDGEQFLGNIAREHKLQEKTSSAVFASLRFRFLSSRSPPSGLFRLDQDIGDLFVDDRLDREQLCSGLLGGQCTVELDIAAYAKGFFESYTVTVVIADRNDNKPEFPVTNITLRIPENTALNSRFTIVSATDADEPGTENSLITYSLKESSNDFLLQIVDSMAGNDVTLLVQHLLNREQTETHTMVVIASDHGVPRMSGSLTVNILVQDVNDHAPEFTHKLYNVTMREDVVLGAHVQHVSAFDKDSGPNSLVMYSFSSRTNLATQRLFSINESTGDITTSDHLDYEQNTIHRMVIQATDQGRSQQQSSVTLVLVHVTDVNDNDPELIFDFLTDQDHVGVGEISETADLGDFVAHVSVFDMDSGENAAVTCHLDDEMFILRPANKHNTYMIILNTTLDREMEDEHSFNVSCSDAGIPPRHIIKSSRIIVLDENDHIPSFNQTNYRAIIVENNNPGDVIVQCSATDDDIGVNSDLIYYISGDFQHNFIINSKTGLIKANVSLDREATEDITFLVYVTDTGTPAMSSSATVNVAILDENDNAPSFMMDIYHFYIEEHLPVNTLIGCVTSEDPDQSIGGNISYLLSQETHSSMYYQILPVDGAGCITSHISFDREITPEYDLQVIATDHGKPPLSTSVHVIVHILDINDNDPVIVFPRVSNNTVRMSGMDVFPMALVTCVVAFDVDQGDNGTLTYSLDIINCSRCFIVDPSTGYVFVGVNGSLVIEEETYMLIVHVTDQGRPAREERAELFINVSHLDISRNISTELLDANHREGKHNLVIILAVVIATFCVSGLLIVVIVLLHKRDIRNRGRNRMADALHSAQCQIEEERREVESEQIKHEHIKDYTKQTFQQVDFIIPKHRTLVFIDQIDDFINLEHHRDDPACENTESVVYKHHSKFVDQRLPPLFVDETCSNGTADSDVTDSGKGGSMDGLPIRTRNLVLSPHYI